MTINRTHPIGSTALILILLLMAAAPAALHAQEQGGPPVFQQAELDQLLAPIALYPDSLLAQIFMASTYPLEIVQADRWAKQNKSLKGEALTAELEKQPWDPSVKSLVNFPQVLGMMSEKLDWTQKLGDAFLAQRKDVMDSVQGLRRKAMEAGTLKTTQEQKVVVEKETIIIESPSPQVIYVPTYNPTVVYGTWAYPAYPPVSYYPPGYTAGAAMLSFGAGMAVGAAWGYAWGHNDWHGGDVDIDVNRNTNINNNINRGNYQRGQGQGQGSWQHSPEHRKGVSYRDPGTAQKYNRASTNDAVKSRENYRGYDGARQDGGRGGSGQGRQDIGGGQGRQNAGVGGGGQGRQDMSRPGGTAGRPTTGQVSTRDTAGRSDAFSGMDRSGGATRDMSSRGSSSRQSMSSAGSSRGTGGSSFGGGSRGGGGRGGGRR
ncbi:MAG TPA: DUF3300 domain-containing protein [Gemmatimonadales bacterium]|nr:DUF3300 domain-containing protein [Gemmatimonadales bacterium]